jgi:sugar lactone lactonase YvrE
MHAWKDRVTRIITLILMFVVGMVLVGVNQVAWAAAGDPVADRILGQPNCAGSAPNTVDPEAMNQPNAVAIDKSVTPNRVYVADTSNNRVLGYSSITALVNGGPAVMVIGQTDLFSSGGGFQASATNLNGPKAVAVDKLGNVYVADTGNNRVLEYNTPFASGKTAGLAANMVFGQGLNFTSNQCNFSFSAPGPNQESMCAPSGVAIDSNGNLFVGDTNNNRVLAFKAPFNAATDANVVFGQIGSFNTA